MAKRLSRRSSLALALGACLVTAPIGAGCSDSSGLDPDIKIEAGPNPEGPIKRRASSKAKQAAVPAPEQKTAVQPR
jgi:hypothetical protein